MNIEDTLAPTSDQLDAIELISGPRTFVVESVNRGSSEQPVEVRLVDFPRVWRPSKGMRRVLAAGWGADASQWAGRSLTLYFDPSVTFGKDRPGGTRIKAMSHLKDGKPLSVPLLITRGKSAIFTVQPLVETARPAAPTPDDIATSTDVAHLRSMWQAADPATRKRIEGRVAELTTADDPDEDGAA